MARAFQTIGAAVFLVSLVLFINETSARNILYPGQILSAPQSLINGEHRLSMLSTCNLALYRNNVIIWQSHTAHGGNGCRLTLNTNGNLAIYRAAGTIIWNNNYRGPHGNYVLILEDNGNLGIYANPVWAQGTASKGKSEENIALPN